MKRFIILVLLLILMGCTFPKREYHCIVYNENREVVDHHISPSIEVFWVKKRGISVMLIDEKGYNIKEIYYPLTYSIERYHIELEE